MFKFLKRKKPSKYVSVLVKAMLRPILLALLPVFNDLFDLWKIELLKKLKLVSPQDLEGFLSDNVDILKRSITDQIKKALEQ